MKTSLISTLVICALLSFGIQARAQDDGGEGDGDHNQQGQDCQDGNIDGSETLVATVTLTATTNAPANASGMAKLISDNEDGTVKSSFTLSITGLADGVYDLSAVRKSDSSTVDLGLFSIGQSFVGDGEDDDESDGDNQDGQNNDGQNNDGQHIDCTNALSGAVFMHVPLPSGLDPMDIGQILISDTNGNILLTGDLVNPGTNSTVKFSANLRVHSASGVTTTVSDKAQAQTTARKGRRSDHFTMMASGVAPNTIFTVQVNGQKVGTVKSNRKGKVLVRKIPANLLLLKSIRLVDPNGQTGASAKF
jgi:hypothetical protein